MSATPAKNLEPLAPSIGQWRSSGTVLDDEGHVTVEVSGTDGYDLLQRSGCVGLRPPEREEFLERRPAEQHGSAMATSSSMTIARSLSTAGIHCAGGSTSVERHRGAAPRVAGHRVSLVLLAPARPSAP